ncbi:MAG: PilZ domain-containing protein [Burkholderiaceae bacterium]
MSSLAKAPPRPTVIQVSFKDSAELFDCYIPQFVDGGIFIVTARDFQLGDDIYLLLTLLDEPHRYPIAGKVSWMTPDKAAGGRSQGVGIQFPKDERSLALKLKIEEILTAYQSPNPHTQTF